MMDAAAIDARATSTRAPAQSGPKFLSFKNIGAVYVWLALIVVFSVLEPGTFPTWATVQQILNQEAITAIVALSLVLPLSAGVFDLSVASNLGFCNVLCAWLIVKAELPIPWAIAIIFVAAVLVGLVNAAVVVWAKIDSLIATLATGALLQSGVIFLSGRSEIVGAELSTGFFSSISNTRFFGINLTVVYLAIIVALIWYILEYTVRGRRLYAIGYNQDAARLAGIRVERLQVGTLISSSLIAGGIGGIAVTSQVASGSTTIGPPYLLPAFAAAFLGATQLRQGKFNSIGTVIAVLMLGTGTVGLALAGAPSWASGVFTGVVLLLALGVTRAERAGSL
jgi:ribose/xylose/arabinose/galactoside ABC-type transport system permease subunit